MTTSSACAIAVTFRVSRTTGKERDTESGNDYFGARYYASSMGRFMSPDWSAKEDDPVPYADLEDPQSLNLYSYVRNNPLGKADLDGHTGCCDLEHAIEEVDRVAGPLINSVFSASEKASTTIVGTAAGVVGFVFTATAHTASEGQDTIHQTGNNGEKPSDPEPQTSTNGAGARSGGGRNAQKNNTDRTESAKNNLVGEKNDLAAAKKLPPSKERSEKIRQAEKQVKHWQSKSAQKSENHSQKQKGQQ
jgi:RHS repeat-associated protein